MAAEAAAIAVFVIELALILAIDFAGLIFALLLGRSVVLREVGGSELTRLGAALRRACGAFLWTQLKWVTAVVATLGVLLLGLFGFFGRRGHALGGLEWAIYAVIGLTLGASLTSLVAAGVTHLGRSASLRSVTAAHGGLDGTLGLVMHAGGAAGLAVQCLSGLGLGAFAGVVIALRGGLEVSLHGKHDLVFRSALLLPAFALGAASAALAWQRAGAVYHAAGDVGADLGGEQGAGLDHDDGRNPALVADLVGDYLGPEIGRSVELFVVLAMANTVGAILGVSVLAANGFSGSVMACVALPFVVRAFGIVASACGLMVVRTEDGGRPIVALWRGQVSACAVALAGLAGASVWLVREHWWRFVLAGALGLGASLAVGHGLRYVMERRFAPLRDLVEAERVAGATSMAQALGTGLERLVFPVLVLGLALSLAWTLGAGAELPGMAPTALVTALMSMLALAPYLLATCTVGSIADNARGLLSLVPGTAHSDVARRTSAIDDAAWIGSNVSQSSLGVAGATAVLLTAGAIPLVAGGTVRPWTEFSVDFSQPLVTLSAVLGAALVLGCAGNAVRASARAARPVLLEVERQLRRLPSEREGGNVPRDFAPSYRVCIELSNRAAPMGSWSTLAATLLTPAALGFGLAVLPTSTARLASSGLLAFVAAAAVAAVCLAWPLEGVRAALGTARRLHRTQGIQSRNSAFPAALTGDAIGDMLGNVAVPTAQLVVKTAALAALVVAPFIH